ncbi:MULTISPECIES: hypothetical protein [Rhizobium]|uniref:hypothetical protein n=1 Tax=Rhizobium TaxID=379 RepID=UPI00040CDC09|nr:MULTISPECIES: hypothetical protein [Rhizobium]UFS81566.1 hypothetical protein LPB79_25170 [Rhizobium sp. T136]
MLGLQYISSYEAPFDPAAARDDAYFVLSGSIIEQRVGSTIAPSFKVTVENPGVAGFMPSANRYAILWEQRAFNPATGEAGDPAPIPLARGRLVPLPTGMSGDTIELTFRCLPPGSDDVIEAAANALRIGEEFEYDPDADPADRLDAEYYDPLYFTADATDDPETVLVARPEVWRWDRATLALRRTHLVESDITHDLDFEGLDAPPVLTAQNPPKPTTRLRIVANWTQLAKGRQTVSEADSVTTFTWEDFIQSFPQPGAAIGSNTGWTMAEAEILSVTDSAKVPFSISGSKFGNASGGTVTLLPKHIEFRLAAAYDYQQQRSEILDISLPSGLQVLPEEDDQKEKPDTITLGALNIDSSTPEWQYEDPETLERMHYNVGDEVLANGSAWTCAVEHDATETFVVYEVDGGADLWTRRDKRAPMRDARNPKFFDLPRGVRAVRHAILRLYRTVLLRSQCAETTFEVPWDLARSITCADSCRIAHRKLPGGELVGKVTSVELVIPEDGVDRVGRITLVSIPGNGGIEPVPGSGQKQTGDVIYTESYRGVTTPVNAFALQGQEPRVYEFENIWSEQVSAANGAPDPVGVIGQNPTRLKIAFTPLREEDLLTRRMSVLCEAPVLPKQINLRPDLGVP